jgi:hypothetical protein
MIAVPTHIVVHLCDHIQGLATLLLQLSDKYDEQSQTLWHVMQQRTALERKLRDSQAREADLRRDLGAALRAQIKRPPNFSADPFHTLDSFGLDSLHELFNKRG